MAPFLSPEERRGLRLDGALSPAPLAVRAKVLLWVDSGASVASVARAFGISRPTVYHLVKSFRAMGDVRAIDPWRNAESANADGRP